jgi:hypothetical protein
MMPDEEAGEEKEKVTFPYESLAAATKDKFAKLGGPDRAFKLLVKGFKSIEWRKRADANARTVASIQEAAQEAARKREAEPRKGRRRSADVEQH